MTHLMLTSALLFALLAVVATAIGASLGIARDLILEEASDTAIDTEGYAGRPSYAGRQARGHGLAEDFGLGLQHASHYPRRPGQSYGHRGSFSPPV